MHAPATFQALVICLAPMLTAAAPLAAAQAKLQQDIPAGFTSLFNGQDLTGWRGRPHLNPNEESAWTAEKKAAQQQVWDKQVADHWMVENGEIVNDGHGAYLTTLESFADFDLRLEYKTVAMADSGIYLRATPQVQIWDTREEGGKWNIGADKGSGGLWNNQKHARHPLAKADKPFGEWNALRIRMVGERVSVWLNGKLTVDQTPMENYWDRSKPIASSGPIQLQTHGGEIRFRNLILHRIETAEANRILSKIQPKGFISIFNGLDFSGWAGPTDGYQIQNGALLCKPGQGGTIYTQAEYADFQVRFEFLLPPGGNNGLAIRYPGKGNAAYDGMCELQVLDNTHPKYADLKTYQFHGSIYGQHPAQRGYLRPVGQWNFEEVTVKGSHIRVELNGTVILDQDIAELEKTMDDHPHPGRTLSSGHFGFAGHQDPVQFRNIRILEL